VIRVLVVDDAPLFRKAFCALLGSDPDLEVVGAAKDGREAIELVQRLQPDIVTMDVNMPVLDGYEAVQQIMALCPTPIIIVTASPSKQDKQAVIKSLAMGALDVVPKPDLRRAATDSAAVRELIAKVKELSSAHVVRHVAALIRNIRTAEQPVPAAPAATRIVAIAASTGGPAAMARILSSLPAHLPATILVAQHIPEGFAHTLANWLDTQSELEVRVAEAGGSLIPSTVLFAPSGRHMRVTRARNIQLLDLPPVHGCKPSADVLLTSVAEAFGNRAIGIVLTGMGQDGASGLKAIRDRGGTTIVQDESTSVVFGMPRAAIEIGAADSVLPLDDIADRIIQVVGDLSRRPNTPPRK